MPDLSKAPASHAVGLRVWTGESSGMMIDGAWRPLLPRGLIAADCLVVDTSLHTSFSIWLGCTTATQSTSTLAAMNRKNYGTTALLGQAHPVARSCQNHEAHPPCALRDYDAGLTFTRFSLKKKNFLL